MKAYRVDYTPAAYKMLNKLDKPIAGMLYAWIEANLVGRSDPRAYGKALSANRAGQWRYRVGNYRLIATINDKTVIILMLAIGHRSTIYDGP